MPFIMITIAYLSSCPLLGMNRTHAHVTVLINPSSQKYTHSKWDWCTLVNIHVDLRLHKRTLFWISTLYESDTVFGFQYLVSGCFQGVWGERDRGWGCFWDVKRARWHVACSLASSGSEDGARSLSVSPQRESTNAPKKNEEIEVRWADYIASPSAPYFVPLWTSILDFIGGGFVLVKCICIHIVVLCLFIDFITLYYSIICMQALVPVLKTCYLLKPRLIVSFRNERLKTMIKPHRYTQPPGYYPNPHASLVMKSARTGQEWSRTEFQKA